MEWQHTLPVPFACISHLFYTCCMYRTCIEWAIFARVRAIWEHKHPKAAVHVPPPLQRYWLRTVLTTYMNQGSSKDVADMKIKRRNSSASTE